MEFIFLIKTLSYSDIRRLENSGGLPENPRVGSSILSLGTIISRGYEAFRNLFLLGVHIGCTRAR